MLNSSNVLPKDALIHIFAHLSLPDIGTAAQVSRQWNATITPAHSALWEALAVRRYGAHVTHATRHLYQNEDATAAAADDDEDDENENGYYCYKRMIQDDNRLGALPTLQGRHVWKSRRQLRIGSLPEPDDYRNNFQCCLILSIKWHRPSNKILFYIDARSDIGDSVNDELRRPQTSGIWVRETPSSEAIPLEAERIDEDDDEFYLLNDIFGIPRNANEYEFVPHPTSASLARQQQQQQQHRSGRRTSCYKGVMRVDASKFVLPGLYQFCYGNATPFRHLSFTECTLFQLKDRNSLMDVFDSFSLERDSPFDEDTLESWNERWRPHLPGGMENAQGNSEALSNNNSNDD